MQALWHEVFRSATIVEIQRWIGLVGTAHAAYHTYPLAELLATSGCPYQRLELFAQYWTHLPLQGSPEWLADKRAACAGGGRVPTFGGSDVDTFLGFNHYQNVRKLYANRLGLEPFSGNNATQWGNMCEEITSLLCEFVFRSATYETGSLPGHRYRDATIQRYSPDRLGVVTHAVMAPYLDRAQAFTWGKRDEPCAPAEPIPHQDVYTVLFEYKNPFNRIPDGCVPKQYTGQMQLGLATIPMADFAVFVDCMIRKCSRLQFSVPTEYCREYHPDARVAPDVTAAPLYSGFIGFYEVVDGRCTPSFTAAPGIAGIFSAIRSLQIARAPVTAEILRAVCGSALPDCDLDAIIDSAPGLNVMLPDYGEWDYIGALTKRACDEKFQTPGLRMHYSNFYTGPPEGADAWLQTAVQKFQAMCTRGGHSAFGIMPYKLYQVSIVPMPRHPDFMKKVAPILEDAYDALSKLVVAPDREAALNTLYPVRTRSPKVEAASSYSPYSAPAANVAAWDDIE